MSPLPQFFYNDSEFKAKEKRAKGSNEALRAMWQASLYRLGNTAAAIVSRVQLLAMQAYIIQRDFRIVYVLAPIRVPLGFPLLVIELQVSRH